MTGMITEFVVIVSTLVLALAQCSSRANTKRLVDRQPPYPSMAYCTRPCDWGAYCNTVLPLHALPCSVVEQSFYLFFNSKYHAHLLWFVYFVYVVRLFGIFELVSRKL